jgi:hypothetical protein
VREAQAGPVFARSVLEYEGPGLGACEVELLAHAELPRVNVAVRMLKEARWEPENVYVPLPFTPHPERRELWIDKAGVILRPRRDQIPGTLTDYYSLQAGFSLVGAETGVAVATPDAPLLQMGPLDPGPRLLAGAPELADDPEHLYSWVMTNFWETNFEASIGGFHEFRYSVAWGGHLADARCALRACRDMNTGLFRFRLAE